MICLIMDGFDVQAMGYVAPGDRRATGACRAALLGRCFAAANFGVLLGSLVFSMVADKIGRRPVLIGATLFFSAMTIATAYAQNVHAAAVAAVHRRASAWAASCRTPRRSSASSARSAVA